MLATSITVHLILKKKAAQTLQYRPVNCSKNSRYCFCL